MAVPPDDATNVFAAFLQFADMQLRQPVNGSVVGRRRSTVARALPGHAHDSSIVNFDPVTEHNNEQSRARADWTSLHLRVLTSTSTALHLNL